MDRLTEIDRILGSPYEFTEERDAWELKNAKNVKLYEDERDRLREALREVLSEMSRRRLTSAERIARAALEAEK